MGKINEEKIIQEMQQKRNAVVKEDPAQRFLQGIEYLWAVSEK